MTRKQFLLTTAALAGARGAEASEVGSPPRVLLVVAHPDDEYAFAATTYRIAKELGGTVDQVDGGPANDRGYHIVGPIKLTGWHQASVVAGDSGLNRVLCVQRP